jgi:hypothetical protein
MLWNLLQSFNSSEYMRLIGRCILITRLSYVSNPFHLLLCPALLPCYMVVHVVNDITTTPSITDEGMPQSHAFGAIAAAARAFVIGTCTATTIHNPTISCMDRRSSNMNGIDSNGSRRQSLVHQWSHAAMYVLSILLFIVSFTLPHVQAATTLQWQCRNHSLSSSPTIVSSDVRLM